MPQKRLPIDANSWLLVRDSMIPVVARDGNILMPLNVLRGASHVLIDVKVKSLPACPVEVSFLNGLCKKSGLTFNFSRDTELVRLDALLALCPDVRIEALHTNDPLNSLIMLKNSMPRVGRTTETSIALETSSKSPSASDQPKSKFDGLSNHDELPKRNNSSELATNSLSNKHLHEPFPVGNVVDQDQTLPSDINPPPLIPIGNIEDFSGLRSRGSGIIMSCKTADNQTERQEPDSERKKAEEVEANKGKSSTDNKDIAIPSPPKPGKIISDVEIIQVNCFQRMLTCILRGKLKARYALVESVMRLYFPQCKLEEFIQYLASELSVMLHTLKKREEKALIKFYGIPTDRLHTNLIIKLKDFVPRVAWLQHRFGNMDAPEPVKSFPIPFCSQINNAECVKALAFPICPVNLQNNNIECVTSSLTLPVCPQNKYVQCVKPLTIPACPVSSQNNDTECVKPSTTSMYPAYSQNNITLQTHGQNIDVNKVEVGGGDDQLVLKVTDSQRYSSKADLKHAGISIGGVMSKHVSSCAPVNQVGPNLMQCSKPQQHDWVAQSYPVCPEINTRNLDVDSMKLPVCNMADVARMQCVNYAFQQRTSEMPKVPLGNAIKRIHCRINREFENCGSVSNPYYFCNPSESLQNNSYANHTSRKRLHKPASLPSKRLATGMTNGFYPLNQCALDNPFPRLSMNL